MPTPSKLMTDEDAVSRIKELNEMFSKAEKDLDTTKLWIILLELRNYSDTKGRIVPAKVFETMCDEMRMISFDGILACLAACANLALPDKSTNN